jgi:hypothetical protein
MTPSRYARKSKCREPVKYFIAFEGSKTEYKYFSPENFILYFRLENVEIIPIQRKNNDTRSDPEHVIKIIDEYCNKRKIKPSDWNKLSIVIDFDKWGDKKLSYILTYTKQKGYGFYVSNSCIELWFILHEVDVSSWDKEKLTPCSKCRRLFHRYFNGHYDELYPKTEIAIKNAKKLNDNVCEQWPSDIGTNIYKLIEQILND